MVWARTRLLIWDYIFEPVKQIKIDYTGKRPDLFYKKVQELLRLVLNIPDGYIQEKEYKWEKHRESESFDVAWEATKIYDTFSYLIFEISLKGFVTAEGEGRASITLKPRLITEYPQDTIWQQSIFYEAMRRAWHQAFYHNKRMQFLFTSKEICIDFERELKKFGEEMRTGAVRV